MIHHGKQPYCIFSKGIRKQAFRSNEAYLFDGKGWSIREELLTKEQADNINEEDMFVPHEAIGG